MSERPLRAGDVPAAAKLLLQDPCWNASGERPLWVLNGIERAMDAGHSAIGSFAGDELRAYASFNFVAGATKTGAISCIARADDSSGIAVLAAAVKELTSGGARLIVAELPDVDAMRGYAALLESAGFSPEASIDGYYSDGIGMRILVARPNRAPSGHASGL